MEERIRNLIDSLSNEDTRAEELAGLDDEQLSAMLDELRNEFAAIRAGEREDTPADDLATLSAIRDAIGVATGEQDSRAEAAQRETEEAAQREADAAALEAEVLGAEEPEEPVEEPVEAAVETTETPEEPAEPEVVEPEVVEAAVEAPAPRLRRPTLAEMARNRPVEAAPRIENTGPRWQDLSGRVYASQDEMAERMTEAINSTEGSTLAPGVQQKIPVIRLHVDRPAEMTLGDDPYENEHRIEAVTAAGRNPADWTPEQQAIVASGGWCAPGEPRYTIPDIATGVRPFRDSLPSMNAARGTVNFVRAARLSTILHDTTAAAVTTWENTTDETPGESVKTAQTIACRTIQEEEVGAVVAQVQIGNFHARAFPEDVAHFLNLVDAAHAKVAEIRLLDALIADINIDVTQTGVVATARDAKHHFGQAVTEIRFTERMGRTAPMRIVVSDVLPAMVVGDITFQAASGSIDALFFNEADAERMLRSLAGVNYTFTRDVPTGSDAFVTNSDGENLADWPDNFEVPIFPDGNAVFVDSGMLDLGIVRDSTLNSTNDYQMFKETFEGLLWLGPYGKTLTLTTCPGGDSQAPLDNTGSLCSGS